MPRPMQLNFARLFAGVLAMGTLARGGIFEFGERPLGSEANRQAAAYIAGEAERMGYDVQRLPFKCPQWRKGASFAEWEDGRVEVFAGPFSPKFDRVCDVVAVNTTGQLQRATCEGKILLVRGTLAKNPLMPRNFPFYFPKEHADIYALLDEKKPAAVLALTPKHPACGLEPFPWLEDSAFPIPSAYLGVAAAKKLLSAKGPVRLKIDSTTTLEAGEQIVAAKRASGESKGKVLLLAHMDTAYGTPGALDNAAGVSVLLGAMERLRDYAGPYDLEFIPFNGEDSGMVKGQLAYLEKFGGQMGDIRLAVNIDGAGAKDSRTAVSIYNLDYARAQAVDEEIAKFQRIERGPEWVEGDHSIFAFQGVPCLAVTSSNLREGVMAISHTPQDTVVGVDQILLDEAADFIAGLVRGF